ncbi:MAG: hypothetical protein K2X39_07655 [Silvanigrellaceae bacterium]|nr:hypothetical protein [Silvanigrellaceae bacterium]
MKNSFQHILLPTLYENLHKAIRIDPIDWMMVSRDAEKWKLSVGDALLELNYLDETTLAISLAQANNMSYIPCQQLKFDFSEVTLENFNDFILVGAAPLKGFRLAICNPYDDHHGYLDNKFCEREMVVTEKSAIMETLRKQGLKNWMEG